MRFGNDVSIGVRELRRILSYTNAPVGASNGKRVAKLWSIKIVTFSAGNVG